VTSFHDAGSSLEEVMWLRQAVDEGRLRVRLYVMLNESNERLAPNLSRVRCVGYGGGRLTVRAIKRMIDGALGTHGAWLLEPYEDQPNNFGNNVTSVETIRRSAELALEHDFQLCVHAIGDRANREVLNLYEAIFSQHGNGHQLRWRVEHAQHLHPDDIPRFGRLGVIASMQAVHAVSDGPFVVERLGWRRAAQGAYVWQSLLRHGAVVVNGTDVPVESIDPLVNFTAAVTRRMANGDVFFGEQAMTRMQALRSYTRDAAFAAFEEHVKGTLRPGKLADVVVVSHNLLTIPEEQLSMARVDVTMVGGKIEFLRHKQPHDSPGRADAPQPR
jgi:predicted amidohydrolase YtcJ